MFVNEALGDSCRMLSLERNNLWMHIIEYCAERTVDYGRVRLSDYSGLRDKVLAVPRPLAKTVL